MPQYTKQALAAALKTTLQAKPLDKITVKELVEACDINRQTFYYHFQDIYDLLGWIYKTEALAAIKNSKSYHTWQQGLLLILEYVQDNKALCINTYRSLAREHLEQFLNEVLFQLLGDVVDEITGVTPLPEDKRTFLTQFYSYAFVGVLLEWIKKGVHTPATELVDNISRIMEDSILLAVRRLQS